MNKEARQENKCGVYGRVFVAASFNMFHIIIINSHNLSAADEREDRLPLLQPGRDRSTFQIIYADLSWNMHAVEYDDLLDFIQRIELLAESRKSLLFIFTV